MVEPQVLRLIARWLASSSIQAGASCILKMLEMRTKIRILSDALVWAMCRRADASGYQAVHELCSGQRRVAVDRGVAERTGVFVILAQGPCQSHFN